MTSIEQQATNRLSGLASVVNCDSNLTRRGCYLTTTFLVEVEATPVYVVVRRGSIEKVEIGSFLLRSWSFAIRATAGAWLRHWESKPPPGYHDIFAMVKCGEARLEGNLSPLMANLQYVKDVVAAPRHVKGEPV